MKKCLSWILAILMLLPLLTVLPTAQADDRSLEIDAATFPDETFRNWVIGHLDVSSDGGYYMTEAQVTAVTAIDVSKLGIGSLKGVEHFTSLKELYCGENHLAHLELDKLTALEKAAFAGQTVNGQTLNEQDGKFTFDLSTLVPKDYLSRIKVDDSTLSFNKNTGVVTFPEKADTFTYRYRVLKPDGGDIVLPELPGSVGGATRGIDPVYMDVTVNFTLPAFDGTVEWNAEDVEFKSTTPYVIANGSAQTPRFTVKDSKGKVVDASSYSYEYRENTEAGTGYVFVTFQKGYSGTARSSFKIYLPATENTYVENRTDGIYVKWDPVEGAAGYVIYRRAWSSTTNGWTAFARWNNTTGTSYLDGADDSHKVYAGTRYQYGVKAYFARRIDPVTGQAIGGNVNEDSGNFNLGEVGPLKTTVRITTRKLIQVRSDRSGQLTVKWEKSKNFTGYQLQIATDQNFKQDLKTEKITDWSTYWKSIDKLKAGTTYYVRIRSYHEFNGMTYFGGWSMTMSGQTKN